MKNVPFYSANILIPKDIKETWPVVACDQYTSEPEYWEELKAKVSDDPSALELILPEVYLDDGKEERIKEINEKMEEYLNKGIFKEYPDAMIFVSRTLPDGKARYGVVGALDLEDYDYTNTKNALIRATEQTVLDRIPPRVEIRRNAKIELPHVLMLIDDEKMSVIEPLKEAALETVYDIPLLMGGGRVKGELIPKALQEKLREALGVLAEKNGLLFASGDGNHSLATAKACYEESGDSLARYALAEIVNIHDPSLEFEPIYRVLFGVDKDCVIAEMNEFFGEGGDDTQLLTLVEEGKKTEYLIKSPKSVLTVGSVEKFIQYYLKKYPSSKVDYIHGEDTVEKLCKEKGAVGFIFPGMRKDELFKTVIKDGVLPRKTFSMGEAASKRYYLESRKIKN